MPKTTSTNPAAHGINDVKLLSREYSPWDTPFVLSEKFKIFPKHFVRRGDKSYADIRVVNLETHKSLDYSFSDIDKLGTTNGNTRAHAYYVFSISPALMCVVYRDSRPQFHSFPFIQIYTVTTNEVGLSECLVVQLESTLELPSELQDIEFLLRLRVAAFSNNPDYLAIGCASRHKQDSAFNTKLDYLDTRPIRFYDPRDYRSVGYQFFIVDMRNKQFARYHIPVPTPDNYDDGFVIRDFCILANNQMIVFYKAVAPSSRVPQDDKAIVFDINLRTGKMSPSAVYQFPYSSYLDWDRRIEASLVCSTEFLGTIHSKRVLLQLREGLVIPISKGTKDMSFPPHPLNQNQLVVTEQVRSAVRPAGICMPFGIANTIAQYAVAPPSQARLLNIIASHPEPELKKYGVIPRSIEENIDRLRHRVASRPAYYSDVFFGTIPPAGREPNKEEVEYMMLVAFKKLLCESEESIPQCIIKLCDSFLIEHVKILDKYLGPGAVSVIVKNESNAKGIKGSPG